MLYDITRFCQEHYFQNEKTMQGRKDAQAKVTLIIFLAAAYILPVDSGSIQSGAGCHWWSYAVSQFFHVNIFHLLLNVFALNQLRFSWRELGISFLIGSLAMTLSAVPVMGASGMIYSIMAFRMAERKIGRKAWIVFAAANAVTAFVPSIAFGVHAASFCMGFTLKLLMKRYGEYRRASKGR